MIPPMKIMRRKERQADDALAYDVLSTAEIAYLTARTESDELVLRALNPIVHDGWVFFHGSHAGEKTLLRGEAIVAAHRVIAEIPSYFIDAELACPATTYYESAEARGELEVVDEPALKDRLLTALMQKYQPEGGHRPIDSTTELYRKQVLATRLFGFQIRSLRGKVSVGQDRPPERVEKVVRGLWRRGAPGDLNAMERILRSSPDARPEFLRGPGGAVFALSPSREQLRAHAELLEPAYWRQISTAQEIIDSLYGSSAWLGLISPDQQLIAAGRAISDGHWTGQICDVIVASRWRGQGYGSALLERLLDHPRVRGVKNLRLGTRDALGFYAKFGFRPASEVPLPFHATMMIRAPDDAAARS